MSTAQSLKKPAQTPTRATSARRAVTNEEREVQPAGAVASRFGAMGDGNVTVRVTASWQPLAARACVVCGGQAKGRSRYCGGACRQRAYRLRLQPDQQTLLAAVSVGLKQQQTLLEHTVYLCPGCDQRLVGERRCPECGLMCRKLGVGGPCPHCDELVVLSEVLDGEPI